MKLQQELVQTQNFPLAKAADLIVQEFKNETLIYNLQTNKAFCLNETSTLVWQACNGNRSVGEISRIVTEKLHSFVSEDFIWLALDQLKRDDLLAAGDDFAINFNGLSRRDVIKKAGLATVVALPMVAQLLVPTPRRQQAVTQTVPAQVIAA